MSLADLMTAVAEYAGDVLVNDLGRPVPDRVLRYHGTLPHDCCTDNGFLVVNWQTEYQSRTFPTSASGAQDPCEGFPVVELRLRYVVCWPKLDERPDGTPIWTDAYDQAADAKTAMLADVADGMQRALSRLGCITAPYTTQEAAVLAAVTGKRLRFVATERIDPLGMCAGVMWRLYASPTAGESPS